MNESKKTFDTINAAVLMEQEFEPLRFSIEKILPHGLFILAGSGKIGKSWLALDMCAAPYLRAASYGNFPPSRARFCTLPLKIITPGYRGGW